MVHAKLNLKESLEGRSKAVLSKVLIANLLSFGSLQVSVHILYPKAPRIEKTVPWWIILISVIAGLCLVAGVVFVFHKVRL